MVKQKYLLVGSLAFAVVYNIPKFFEMNIMYLDNGDVVTVESEMRKNKHYQQFYVFWSKMILIEIFPYVTIIVLNTLILTKTLKASRFRSAFGAYGGGGGGAGGAAAAGNRANSVCSGIDARSKEVDEGISFMFISGVANVVEIGLHGRF